VLETHDFGIEAVTPSLLHRFPRDELQEFADAHSNFGRRMRELSARQARASRDHMILLGRKTATERLASFLTALAARLKLEDGAWIVPPMSRSDIADYLGITIETVCRQLKRLRKDGTISANGTKILIHDPRSLAECATLVIH
jgi:CRP/FNR family transcriptional regulator